MFESDLHNVNKNMYINYHHINIVICRVDQETVHYTRLNMAEGNSAFPLFSPHETGRNAYTTNELPSQEEMDRINMQLYDMFVDCIDPCVIQEVAVSRNFNS